MNKLDMLRNAPLFESLNDDELHSLARTLTERSFKRGMVIFQEQDYADALFLILAGKVKVMLTDQDGNEVIVSLLGDGECFGEMGLFGTDGRSAQVVAMTDVCLLVLAKGDFGNWLERNASIALKIIQQLSQRLRKANSLINNLATLDVQSRVARVLLESAEQVDGQLQVAEPLTQQDMASMVGASRERVNRALKKLEKSGFIRMEGRRILVLQAQPS